MNREVVFISYYTPNYKKWADNLRDSLGKQRLKHDIVCIEHQTDSQDGKDKWQAAVRYKPQFILDMLKKHKDCRGVVWIDADGLMEKKPELLLKMREDLGARFAPHPAKNPRKYELLSGTVFVKNTPAAIKMMESWVKAMPFVKAEKIRLKQAPLLKPEQQILQALLTIWKCVPEKFYNKADGLLGILCQWERCKVSVKDLPEPYCHIHGHGGDGAAVVSHHQASREWRWPEKAARRRAMMNASGHYQPSMMRRARKPKPRKVAEKNPKRGLPISRRRRRRMGQDR